MNIKQRTLKESVTISGVGLHSGVNVSMTFKPAPENHGYKFQRIDLPGAPVVEADVDNVINTERGTTIQKNGTLVGTIEHSLAAMVGMELDNVLIELDGPEVPIMDGSALPFIDVLESVGLVDQDEDREYFHLTQNVHYKEPDRKVEMIAMPSEDYRLTVMVDYNSPVLGTQHANITSLSEFKNEISPCRTFCFMHELEWQLKNNLIKGGDLNNAIVIVDRLINDKELQRLASLFNRNEIAIAKEGILNNVKLRYQNEPARHKLLDVIGDLALIGTPLKAHIMAARPGHAANIAFAKKLKHLISKKRRQKDDLPEYDINDSPLYDTIEVMKRLPHRPPFLLIDKILQLTNNYVLGIKNVTMNEPFFIGHFPSSPVMPGVLLIEALAQNGGILILNTVDDPENYLTYFMTINNARFKKIVKPGDTLTLYCKLIAPIRSNKICQMKGIAYVGSEVVAEAEMMAKIVKQSK